MAGNEESRVGDTLEGKDIRGRSVGIRIYTQGAWGSVGSLGQVTHHDRSNSVT